MGSQRRTHPHATSEFPPVKRLTDVVEIFAIVRAKMPAKLVLIGDGPDRGAAEYLIRKKKLQKDVFFLGKQDNVYEKLAAADLFLLPSQLESFGLAALEAMACRSSVIATNVGGVPEVVEHGVDGFLVEPGDVRKPRATPSKSCPAPTTAANGQIARINAKKNSAPTTSSPPTKPTTSASSPNPDVGVHALILCHLFPFRAGRRNYPAARRLGSICCD